MWNKFEQLSIDNCCFLCNVHSPFHFPSAHVSHLSNDLLLANAQSHEKCNNKRIESFCQEEDQYFHLFNTCIL